MMYPVDRVLLAFLVLDGAVVGLLAVGFSYLRFWDQPVPFVALAAGLVNALLLWLAARCTDSPLRFGPLVAWTAVLVIASFPGPGANAAVSIGGTTAIATLFLVLLGLGIPMALVWSGRLPQPD